MIKTVIIKLSLGIICASGLCAFVQPAQAKRPPRKPIAAQATCDRQQILSAESCNGDGLESEEKRLHKLINQYRAQNGLSPIALSRSLSKVANRHVQDLDQNLNELTHGWSNCPYDTSDTSSYACMWEAPQRFGTAYKGYGYENAYGGGGTASAADALESWQSSSAHNAVILNQGMWADKEWQALGIGLHNGYAVLWFGDEVDPAGTPSE